MIEDEQQGLMSSAFVLGILSEPTMQGAMVGSWNMRNTHPSQVKQHTSREYQTQGHLAGVR